MTKTFVFTKKRLVSLTNNGTARDVYHDAKVQGKLIKIRYKVIGETSIQSL